MPAASDQSRELATAIGTAAACGFLRRQFGEEKYFFFFLIFNCYLIFRVVYRHILSRLCGSSQPLVWLTSGEFCFSFFNFVGNWECISVSVQGQKFFSTLVGRPHATIIFTQHFSNFHLYNKNNNNYTLIIIYILSYTIILSYEGCYRLHSLKNINIFV